MVYIGFDIVRVNQYYGEAAAEDQLCFAANELRLSIHDNEAAAPGQRRRFCCGADQQQRTRNVRLGGALLERLNRYMERYEKDYPSGFSSGHLYASDLRPGL